MFHFRIRNLAESDGFNCYWYDLSKEREKPVYSLAILFRFRFNECNFSKISVAELHFGKAISPPYSKDYSGEILKIATIWKTLFFLLSQSSLVKTRYITAYYYIIAQGWALSRSRSTSGLPRHSEKASLSVPASRGGNEVFGSGGVHNSPGGLRQLPHHFPGLTQRSHTNQERISRFSNELVDF
ncbi:UNVERIFIED_CONTAM: hypothetical protein NCL1_30544 [Trichonephila clavipes]